MDPGEDIIDVLYKKNGDEKQKQGLKRQLSRTLSPYGFDYQHPPSRNYYEDLYSIQRRNFHQATDSVFEKTPLCRTDSVLRRQNQVSTPYFSFPSPSRQEKLRRTQLYGSLRRQGSTSKPELDTFANDDIDDPFYTPDSDDKSIYKSLRKEIIAPDEEIKVKSNETDSKMYIELSNGVKQRRFPLSVSTDNDDFSRSSSRGGGIYSSIDSNATSEELNSAPSSTSKDISSASDEDRNVKMMTLVNIGNNILGLLVMIVLSNWWSNHLQQLHENDMWFSNIEEVKREISFRTEQGFYYSFYKQLIAADSLQKGIKDLERDNLTEHTNTINAWKRFNIYQELALATIHRIYSFNLEPILFYVEVVFSLQGLQAAMYFLISWTLSGTWVSGVLALGLIAVHGSDITRVSYTVPLREHFSLPFFYAMLASISRYLTLNKNSSSQIWSTKEFVLVQIFVMTVLFTITWQFAQFALLLHSIMCFMLASAQLLKKEDIYQVFCVQLLALLTVWYCQYYQFMVITSLVVSFLPLAMLSLYCTDTNSVQSQRQNSILKNLVNLLVVKLGLVLIGTIALNKTLKSFTSNTDDDNHIFQFVASWFGFEDETNFDTRLYKCLSAFKPLGWQMYKNLTANGALPIYVLFMSLNIAFLFLSMLRKWYVKDKSENEDFLKSFLANEDLRFMVSMDENPQKVYHIGISAIFCILGMLMARMIVFWSPYIMIMTSVAICDQHLWTLIANKLNQNTQSNKVLILFLRHLVLLFALVTLYISHKESIMAMLEELREFWDPDTVDLMQWIKDNTPNNAAFAGTMQLLAGVKLCTGRPITNHPHFEDTALRIRTKELYQMYGQFSPQDVYETMVKFNTSYIILEDSQCLSAGQNPDRCAMPDTVDLSYGHIPADGKKEPEHLVASKHPRFCDEIRYGSNPYSKYFRLVFHNRTFRVYEVKPPKTSEGQGK